MIDLSVSDFSLQAAAYNVISLMSDEHPLIMDVDFLPSALSLVSASVGYPCATLALGCFPSPGPRLLVSYQAVEA